MTNPLNFIFDSYKEQVNIYFLDFEQNSISNNRWVCLDRIEKVKLRVCINESLG